MRYLRRLLLMIQFLTRIPLPVNLDADSSDFGKGLVFAPAVGLMLGGIMAGCFYVLDLIFPVYVTVVFVIVIYIILTGGLHLDGLGDTFDGLFSNRTRERILEILRDSRVGTNAVLAIVCVLLVDVSVLSSFDRSQVIKVLALMPAAGRIGSLVSSGISSYARSGEGLGKSFIDFCGTGEIAAGLIISFPLFYVIAGIPGLLAAGFSVLTALAFTWLFSRKIGGATGDILGAVCELNQTFFLLFVYIIGDISMFARCVP